MNIWIPFLFLLSVVSPVYALDENINMVENPGFEFRHISGVYGNIPLYWERYSGGSGSSSIAVSSWGKQGNSLKLTDNSSSESVGVWSDPIPVIPGRGYSARVWGIKSAGTVVAKMYFKFFDDNGSCIATPPSVPVGSVGSWGESVKTAAAPVGSSYMRILLFSDNVSEGYVYFDNVSLTLDEQMVSDGDFSEAVAGQLPAFWSVYPGCSGSPQTQQAYNDSGNMMLRLYDGLTDAASGAYCLVPAGEGIPYTFSASVRKVDGTGYASMYLKYYDADNNMVGNYSVISYSGSFTNLTISQTAPAGTAYAKLVCYTGNGGTGTYDFDNISFTENYTLRYVAPAAVGDGQGLSAANAACHTDSAFWNAVNAAASSSPVKVIFLSGTYSGLLHLDQLGNANHEIVLEGERPFGTIYNDTPTNAQQMIWLTRSENITIRHFHFTYAADKDDLEYCLSMGTVLDYSMYCHDIRIEGCSAVDAMKITRGFSGAHGTSYDVTWDRCSVVWLGVNDRAHAFYSMKADELRLTGCYTEDIAGASIKFKDDCRDVLMENCTLVDSATYPTTITNCWFVYIEAVNVYSGSHETLPEYITLRNNTFEYLNPGAGGAASPIMIKMEGGAPAGFTAPAGGGLYMIPETDGAAIADTSNSAATRDAYLYNYCDYSLLNGDLVVDQCTFEGCSTTRARLWRKNPNPASGYYEGLADIDALLGLD